MDWHVLPTNDLKEHEETEYCHCKPKVEVMENGNRIIIHNSYDGREIVETTEFNFN